MDTEHSQQYLTSKEIIQRFSNERLMLRPLSLKKLEALFRTTASSKPLSGVLEEVVLHLKNLMQHNHNVMDKGIIEPQLMEEAIELLQNSSRVSMSENQMETAMNGLALENAQTQDNSSSTIDSVIKSKLSSSIVCLNAFQDFPNVYYDNQKHGFELKQPTHQLFSSPEAKVEMFNERFDIVKEKLMRSSLYRFPHQDSLKNKSQDSCEISAIGSLLGASGSRTILGLLTQQEFGSFFLEDSYTKVKLNTKALQEANGFFVEGNVVLAKGRYNDTDNTFHVQEFIQPLIDYKEFSGYMQRKDTFGAATKAERILSNLLSLELSRLSLEVEGAESWQDHKKLEKAYANLEQKQQLMGIYDVKLDKYWRDQDTSNVSVIVLSNLMINEVSSLENFDKLLSNCSSLQPFMFIVTGELSSCSSFNSTAEYEEFNQHIDAMIKVLDKYPELEQHCYWVFLPGNTTSLPNTLPHI